MSANDAGALWGLPASWQWTQIGDITAVVGGGTPRTTDPLNWSDADVAWVTPADLSGYTKMRIARGARNISRRGLDSSGARMLPAGTVLMSSRAPVGYVAVASGPLSTNQGFKSFLPSAAFLPEYLFYFLLGNKELVRSFASGTTFLEVSGAKAAQIPFPVAPLAEQCRIVTAIEEHLSRLDAAVTALERVRAQLPRYRAAALKAACEGLLVPTEAEQARSEGRDYERGEDLVRRIGAARGNVVKVDLHRTKDLRSTEASLPTLPEGWAWTRLHEIGLLARGKSRHRPRDDARLYGGPHPFIQTGDVKHSGGIIRKYTQTYSDFGLAQSRMWPAGTLCITIAANIADTGILAFDACFPDSVVGFLYDGDQVTTRFLELVS